ncbi:MAG: hypothetical protein EA411_02525 [Saprospirales bacterium]|nr:MAG: hypothetical protein EA411_02525 [Saprospirales bacterium]
MIEWTSPKFFLLVFGPSRNGECAGDFGAKLQQIFQGLEIYRNSVVKINELKGWKGFEKGQIVFGVGSHWVYRGFNAYGTRVVLIIHLYRDSGNEGVGFTRVF